MYDLLTDPLIGVRIPNGERRMNLPELLAELSAGSVDGYTGLRAHQSDPWHVFLVQLAASIQARCPTEKLPADAAYWREGLLDLSEGKASAWELVVEDVTQPAFMQHPWKSWDAEAENYGVKTVRGQRVFEPKATTPDELDVLVTAKNHDVKMARAQASDPEAWLYALLLLQTTSGYLGAGNYGIVRMNGGFASRPIVCLSPTRHPSGRFIHEVQMLLGLRTETIRLYRYAEEGVVLSWLTSWNRNDHQWRLNDLEPWFIEAARPVRLLQTPDGAIIALGATSKARQIGPKTLESGDVGDPWIPINVKKNEHSAMKVRAEGFTPHLLTRLLFKQDFVLTPLQEPSPGNGDGWFLASSFARDPKKGTTEGFHRVELPVPHKAGMALLTKASRDSLGHLAQQMLGTAKEVQKALGTALTVLAEGGPEKADFDRVDAWIKALRIAFSQRWETLFFPSLWRGAEEDHNAVLDDWQQRLVDLGQELLDEATERLPLPANRTWRAITQAERAWRGMLRNSDLPMPRIARTEHSEALEETTA